MFTKKYLLTILTITYCILPVCADDEEQVRSWKSRIESRQYAGIEKEIETAKKEANDKNDLVRVSALEELQDQIKRGKAAASGAKIDNATTLDDAVKMQMAMLQSMAEKFARQHHGKYPIVLDEQFKGYFPMITFNKSNSTAPFFNPFTKKQEWFGVKPIDSIDKAADNQNLLKGQIVYCPVKQGTAYAIIGGAHDGKLLRDKTGQTLIMTKK